MRTCLCSPHVCRCVEGDDVDLIFEELQQLVKLLLTAAAVSEDLHLVNKTPRRSRLDVLQVHPLLLQEEEDRGGERIEKERGERRREKERGEG